MIKYLIAHPVSVFVSFAIAVMLGLLAYFHIPTSLLPDIPVPEISVRIAGDNLSARELENLVVAPLRQQLMQVGHLRDIRSETQDEQARLSLVFDYGTRMNLAFVETNEKVDAAMNSLPKSVSRPQVVKTNASDLPVFDLILTLRADEPFAETNESSFLQLCDLAQNVIKRRLEQLPEVAMVDVSGLWERQLVITADHKLLASMGITGKDIEQAFANNNVETGGTTVRNGNYEYNIRFVTSLRTPEEVGNIIMRNGNRLFRLKDVARIEYRTAEPKGETFYNGKRALVLSVIKQPHAKMEALKQQIDYTLGTFGRQYSAIDFAVTHDQSELLVVTMNSLKRDLLIGMILIFVVTFLFMRNAKLPFVIGLSLIVSLIISIGALYLFRISLNIVSLAGLILSVGMMIDSAIIVTDDITQYRQQGYSLDEACIKGTEEVITPMLSSTLTTIAVFLPLIFLSGIAGALFYDQALSVTLSLLVSYITAVLFTPVLYKIFFLHGDKKGKGVNIKSFTYQFNLYDKAFTWAFAHKKTICSMALGCIPLCFLLYAVIEKEKMPALGHNEVVVAVNWNENIHIDENTRRTHRFIRHLGDGLVEYTALVARQQFLIGNKRNLDVSETKLYIKAPGIDSLEIIKNKITDYFESNYPKTIVTLSPPETVFEEVFPTSEPEMQIELFPANGSWAFSPDSLGRFREIVQQNTGEWITPPPYDYQLQVHIDYEKMLMYDVSYDEVVYALKNCLGDNRFATLRSSSGYLPVSLGREKKAMDRILSESFVKGSSTGEAYPLNDFVSLSSSTERKKIVAGRSGEYLPFQYRNVVHGGSLEEKIRNTLVKHPEWSYSLSGTIFENREMLNGLLIVLLVSIVLMYLIMTAQFESFVQPLILLSEIPIDIAAALALLMLFGQTMNLMSAIGIVVTCGIIVNDSILKINLVNELRASGKPLYEAIHQAGRRRLRAIVMTSLTTIFALAPILFSHDMGSELQKPLAVAMIGAMFVGTLVSLFVVPLFYWFVYHKKQDELITE